MKQISKFNIITCIVVISALLISCGKQTNTYKNDDLQYYKSKLCNYFDDNRYNYDIDEENDKEILIKLSDKRIVIFLNVKPNSFNYIIQQTNELNDIGEKYSNIAYDTILEISTILNNKKITKTEIQKVVENEKNFYKTEKDSNYIMHKEKSFGFYDVPRINYTITYDNDDDTYEEELVFVGKVIE